MPTVCRSRGLFAGGRHDRHLKTVLDRLQRRQCRNDRLAAADVALHALTDAVLGTIGAGDIGQHFPPSDPQWRGASSDRFLRHAVGLVSAKGGRILHLDLTVVCEAPKVGPHREKMRESIARIAGIASDRVSVKATTTDGMGFTGRREGMAAQAIATVRLP